MFVRVRRGSSVPISRQIEAQIRAQIASGAVGVDERLPSVRQLAKELAVNVNTVVRVYERLSGEGLIELRHGDGTFVAPRRRSEIISELADGRREFHQEIDALVRRALMLGVTIDELPRILKDAIKRVRQDASFIDSLT